VFPGNLACDVINWTMNEKLFMLATLVVLSLAIGSSGAIKCYDCLPGDSCRDPFKKNGVGTCDGSACMKAKASTSQGEVVTRSCFPGSTPPPQTGCESESRGGASVTACLCTTDLCNSAQGLHQRATVYALLATSAAVVLLAKLQG